jgi:hypothetical protein
LPFIACYGIVHYRLYRFGIRKEFTYLILGVAIAVVAAILVMFFVKTEVGRSRGLDLCIFWGMTVVVTACGVYPLWLVHRHDRLQRKKQGELARADKLDQLLAIPEGFHAFLLFCGSEFNSERYQPFAHTCQLNHKVTRERHS